MAEFVGRSGPLARLTSAYRAAAEAPPIASASSTALLLVTGEAGIGKTALLRRFVAEVEADAAGVAWGSCWDDEQAPAWWPWTEALRRLVDSRPWLHLPETIEALLTRGAVPEDERAEGAGGRVRLLDEFGGLLSRASAEAPVVVVLDDLQWSDASSVDLLRFMARRPREGRLLLVGAYRPGEARREVAAALAELAMAAEHVPLQPLGPDEVAALVAGAADEAVAGRWSASIHARSGGHPFFVRELCRVVAEGGDPGQVPPAVRDVVMRRLDVLSPSCAGLLRAAAVCGATASVDLLAEVTDQPPVAVLEQVAEAVAAGALVEEPDGPGFGHDLYRESVLGAIPAGTRVALHGRVRDALAERRRRGGVVPAGELARHGAAALSAAGEAAVGPLLGWAREAAGAEEARFAFAEAAGHLERARHAIAAAGLDMSAAESVGVAVAEADLRLKAGDAQTAHDLLESAWEQARALDDAGLMAAVALGLDRCGARFAMRRDQLVGVLETARRALDGTGVAAEAEVTAALSRQLQHSVPAERPRARPLAEAAVAIARGIRDPTTLAGCLLAQHDSLWTPGTAARRVGIAQEIADLARTAGDRERLAQALLLTANAQLETGSPAFRATAQEYVLASRALRQPRHDYLVRTREAALALLDGDIELGDRLSEKAAALGDEIGETDTGNVRMSQRLEVVRAHGDGDELRAMAAEAVAWWVGAPAHAHAVAAGFLAQAGDLDGARRELDTVLALDDWRADRSYLWSVFVGQLATAAVALGDLDLCRRLVDDLRPLRSTCAVNGALVCFMGAHAHHLGELHAALGDRAEARVLLTEALRTHQRLGARAWEQTTAAALAALDAGSVSLRRTGRVWEVGYRGQAAAVRHSKGLQDLAVLVARPGLDVAALELMGAAGALTVGTPDPVLDRTALASYRNRLGELDDQLGDARAAGDLGRVDRAVAEREHLLAELRRSTRPDGRARTWDNRDSERARKAVSARIRDAIERIGEVLPELGGHLDRSVTTGTTCRYQPRD